MTKVCGRMIQEFFTLSGENMQSESVHTSWSKVLTVFLTLESIITFYETWNFNIIVRQMLVNALKTPIWQKQKKAYQNRLKFNDVMIIFFNDTRGGFGSQSHKVLQ